MKKGRRDALAWEERKDADAELVLKILAVRRKRTILGIHLVFSGQRAAK